MRDFLDPSFDNEKYNDINLSTSTSTSSTALLNSVRQQRQAREQRRKEDHAAILIQTRWRGFSQRKQTIERILLELENGQGGNWQATGRKLVLLAKAGNAVDLADRRRKLLVQWCEQGKAADPISGVPLFIASMSKSEDWIYVLSILTSHILDVASTEPASAEGRSLLETLEVILDPRSWAHLHSGLASAAKAVLVGSIAQREWVEKLVTILEALIAASLPKKKHPSLNNVIQLLTAPLTLTPVKKSSPLLPPLLHTLLAVRALPTSLPIPALTQLSGKLPIFTILLPLAASNPDILSSGRLASEMGKTYFLANLATFGITGGLLARHGAEGIANWIKVIGGTISGIQEGWARWVDGEPDEDDDDEMVGVEDSDDEDDEDDKPRGSRTQVVVLSGPSVSQFAPPTRITPKRLRRGPPLPPNIRSKLVLLTSSQHLSILAQHATRASTSASTNPLLDLSVFVSGLLNAFKGSPRWEAILEVLIDDGNKQNKQLVKTLWREGVRGRWGNSSDKTTWDTFAKNPNTPCLVFMTLLYNHYLLITPDDEFFDSNGRNPLTIDEVLDLAGIWRDLAFWSYMNGVEAAGAQGRGSEDQRNLLTRGVVRLAEKNARHKFADEDFWVMASHMNLQGFIEAAVFEDAELSSSAPAGEDPEDPSIQLPRWARHRQRFSKRQMAYISPRLGLLNNLPMAIPFQTRLSVFRQFIESDYTRMRSSHARQRKIRATIKRTSLAQDGFDQLGSLGAALKGRIDITFIDKFGQEEMGIDGGGLFKEFLTSLSKEVFDTNRGLWLATDQNELYPNPHSYATEDHQLQWYSFIGRVLGKALYEGILVDVSFANFFLAKWLGRQSYLDDLQSLDKDLYKGLIMLKNYPKPEDLSLNFAITQEEFGVTSSIDLVPGGSEIPVTAENRHEYIQLVCRYKLDKQIAAQSRAFFDGLSDIIDSKWLRMFDQQELRQLIGGEETLIDLDDLRAHVHVTGFPNDVTMKLFWRVVKRFTQEERRALLRFVTSCSRPPLLGFAYLYPQFGIRCAGGDQTRLPSASACANLLKLPSYQDEEALRSKLLQAITSAAGFDLS